MSKFVIHKKGFFYTDEAFVAEEGAKGSIVGTYNTIEEARVAKLSADIVSLQEMKGMNAVDFYFESSKYNEIYRQLEAFYKNEYGMTIEDKHHFLFPNEISEAQAMRFLEIMELSFHDIVEYGDDVVLNPEDFDLSEMELDEF